MPQPEKCAFVRRSRDSRSVWLAVATGLCVIALGSPPSVRASLGGDFASVQSDVAKMQATLRTTSASAYTMHQIQAPTGVTVNEYVSPAGQVFAVTWQGPSHPDLRQLFGSYFDQFTQAVEAQRAGHRGHGPLMIQQSGLVVQISGHPRSFQGKAYLPQMLPAGVRAEDIR